MELTRIFRCIAILVVSLAFSCSAFAQGVSADEIVLGQTSALTGPLAELGQDNVNGAKAYFDFINARGGINGRKIRLITLDDGYNPERAVVNVKQLIDDEKVLALFGVLGTPANVALMPVIAEAGIPSFGPASGSDAVRKPFNRLIFHSGASYADELDKIAGHLRVRGLTKIGVVYQDNAFGKDGLANLERSLVAHKLTLTGSAGIDNAGADADKVSAALAQGKPQAIIMITAGKASGEFIKSYNKQPVTTQYFALSVMASQGAIRALGSNGVGVVVSQVSPFPFSATSGIVQEYQKVMAKQGVKNFSFSSIAGFINAKLMVEGLRRAGKDLTRERLINALETMGKIDYDGFIVNYSKTNHLGARYVELTVISKDGRFLR